MLLYYYDDILIEKVWSGGSRIFWPGLNGYF